LIGISSSFEGPIEKFLSDMTIKGKTKMKLFFDEEFVFFLFLRKRN
jgi:hypothetical protein